MIASLSPLVCLLMLVLQGPAQGPAAGAIKGRVTDAVSGAPIAGAIVALARDTARPAVTRANDVGEYSFSNLAAGAYHLSAEPPEYRATHLYTEFVERGKPGASLAIDLAAGEVRNNVVITMRRSLAITGRVVDEWGLPLAGIPVSASTSFRNRLGGRATDDRGMFRIFGLQPGRYYVCAAPRGTTTSISGAAPKTRSVPTCYPSATVAGEAKPVTLAQVDVEGVELRIARAKAYSISGTIVDSRGRVPQGLTRVERDEWGDAGSRGETTMVSDGQFKWPSVLPGDYLLAAEPPAPDGRYPERAEARVTVTDSDVEAVTLTMLAASSIQGRVVFEDEPPPPDLSLAVRAANAATVDIPTQQRRAQVKQDLTFELTGLLGPTTLAVDRLPSGWSVRSVRYGDRDIVETPTTFKSGDDSTPVEIVLTHRGPVLSGSVVSEALAPAAGIAVLIFPTDAAKWRDLPAERQARTSKEGRFAFSTVRAGEYYVLAMSPDDVPAYPNAAFFARAAKAAERVVLGAGERRSVELRVAHVDAP